MLAKPLTLPGFAAAPHPTYAAPVPQEIPPAPVERKSRPAVASASVSNSGTAVQGWKPKVKPPFVRSDPSHPLSCRNEKSATGRIRMVCQ